MKARRKRNVNMGRYDTNNNKKMVIVIMKMIMIMKKIEERKKEDDKEEEWEIKWGRIKNKASAAAKEKRRGKKMRNDKIKQRNQWKIKNRT